MISKYEFELFLDQLLQSQTAAAPAVAAAASTDPVIGPTGPQLRSLALRTAIPMMAFGFCDNAIMILAGDVIEEHVGEVLNLSTMASAGLGNMFADVAGIGLSGKDRLTPMLGPPS